MPPSTPTPNLIPVDILRDLACRFTANIPTEERNNIRICFQIELAYWLFIDHYCKPSDKLHHLAHIPFNVFAWLMFQVTPYLQSFKQAEVEKIIADFKEYKWKVPTYGAILMDKSMSQVLLVQGFGNSWGFPKGKVNKDEEAVVCAIREVKEETGYDITALVNPNHFIESNANDRSARLYIVVGVDTQYPFKPQTQYEILQIGWFNINELPESKKDTAGVTSRGYNVNQFYPVFHYLKRLKRWIADKKSGENQINCFRCSNSSMRFPYSNDKRTVWDAESPMPGNNGGRTRTSPMPAPVSSSLLGTGVTAIGAGDHDGGSSSKASDVGLNILEKTFGSKPSDDKKWAARFQAVQQQTHEHAHTSKSEPYAAAARGHGQQSQSQPQQPQEKFIATRSNPPTSKDKNRQVKRRLQFDEHKTATAPTTSVQGKQKSEGSKGRNRGKAPPEPEYDPNFFDGPGAKAWLNFTLSLNDFVF